MKNQKTSILISFLTIIFLFSNCKDPEPNVPNSDREVIPWEKLENFQERIYNMEVIDNKLFATGEFSFFYDVDINSATQSQSFRNFITRVGRYKFPVSDKVLVSRSETDIFIFPSNNISPETLINISKEDLDPQFRFFEDLPRWESDFIGLTQSGIALLPYRKFVNGFAKNTPNFLLIKSELDNGLLKISDFKIIDEELVDYYTTCSRIESFNDFFLVHFGGRTYKITTDGIVSQFNRFPAKSVQINNITYSFVLNTNNNKIEVYTADLWGNNPNLIAESESNEIFRRGEFFRINNQIIVTFRNNIYLVKIENGNLKTVELENSSLDVGDIYDLVLLQDNSVLLSNICNTTNCGLFRKDLNDFLQPKPVNN